MSNLFCSSVACAFGVIGNQSLPNQRSRRLTSVFISKCYIIVALTFRLFDLFWKYMVWGRGSASFFCMKISSCPSTVVEKTVFPLLNGLDSLVENWVYFWILSFIPLICIYGFNFVHQFSLGNSHLLCLTVHNLGSLS